MSAMSAIAQHLLRQLAPDAAPADFWDSYWGLAPWLTADETVMVHRAAGAHRGVGSFLHTHASTLPTRRSLTLGLA